MDKKYLLVSLLIVVVLTALVTLSGLRSNKINKGSENSPAVNPTFAPNQVSTSSREIQFQASDGYKLSATYHLSLNLDGKHPVVILVHQFNSTRADFDQFIPVLLKKGFTVLAYDIRGMGQSQNGPTQINDFPKDVSGAVTFLRTRKEVDQDKIAVIGASVGANVAFVASGSIPEIKAAVSLSPSNTGSRGVLMGQGLTNFNPRNIFVVSDEREKTDADVIFSLSKDPKQQKVYPGFGHGVSLLKSPEALKDIIGFLSELQKVLK